MKKFYLLFIAFCAASPLFAQTLFTYGGSSVDKAEFLRAYNKNKTPVTDKEKALRDYLDLYVKFKLKVKAAKDLGIDTLPQLKSDVESFKAQIEESYMNNEPALNALIDEAFNRGQQDLHVLHFFVAADRQAKPEDTLKAFKALNEVAAQLKADNNNYDKTAAALSQKYIAVKASDLGFITVFSIPYEYENIVYSLKPGETSKPYRTAKGFHSFTLVETRPSAGRWRAAQILLAIPPGDNSKVAELKKKADSIYNVLQHGADFAALAKQLSDDKMTYMTGGEMPEFGTGKFDLVFENEVLKLKKDGDISHPFQTSFGFHIVKRLKQTPTPTVREDVYMMDLKQKVLQDSRVDVAKKAFLKDVLKQVGLKKSSTVKDADIFRFADSVAAKIAEPVSQKSPIYDKTIFSVDNNAVKGSEWLNFVHDYKANGDQSQNESSEALYEKFIAKSALAAYKKRLEELNPDYRYQMEEFRDGNVLFEIMERNVWSVAGNDSSGLQQQYNEHKDKYLWAASATVLVFNCSNKTVAEEAMAALKAGKDWHKIVEEKNGAVQVDSGRYELSQIPMENGLSPAAGIVTSPVANPIDGSASFIKFIKLYDAGLPRSFEEARGLVINDYQLILEDKWIESLKKKYPVKINESVFESLLK